MFEQNEFGKSSVDIPLESGADGIYDQDAFHYFVELEHKRSERSTCSPFLLLVDLEDSAIGHVGFDPADMDRLFFLLAQSVRETDFVGWYRDGHVAGAMLTQLQDVGGPEALAVVAERVERALRAGFAPTTAARLHVRAYQLSAEMKGRL